MPYEDKKAAPQRRPHAVTLPPARGGPGGPIILRTNAKTGRRKCSRMHNLENHSQKGLYKCGFLWYLHISNNSCY